jgi:hypothetical protein
MAYKGHHLSDQWDVVDHSASSPDDAFDTRHPLLKWLGLYWVGPPWSHSVYYYVFEWNETQTDPSTGKQKVRPRKEATDFVYVNDFPYAIVTDRAETSDRLQTDLETDITMQVTNPYRALFETEDWMRRATAKSNGFITPFVGGKSYDEMLAFSKQADKNSYTGGLLLLSDGAGGLKALYGFCFKAAELQTFDLSGSEGSAAQQAAMKEYIAKQNAKAKVIDATAAAEAKVIDADATAKATKTTGFATAEVTERAGVAEANALGSRMFMIASDKETGIALAGFDAMKESAQGDGNTVVFGNPLDKLVDAAKVLVGK